MKIKFICQNCKKEIEVQEDIYKKVYEYEKICLSCRSIKHEQLNNELRRNIDHIERHECHCTYEDEDCPECIERESKKRGCK